MEINHLEKLVLDQQWGDAMRGASTISDMDSAVTLLGKLAKNQVANVRLLAISCLEELKQKSGLSIIVQALEDPDERVRMQSLGYVSFNFSPFICSDLIKNLNNPDEAIREKVALILGENDQKIAANHLRARLNNENSPRVKRALMLALARLGDDKLKSFFLNPMAKGTSEERYQALQDARYINDRTLASILLPALDDKGDAYLISSKEAHPLQYALVRDAVVNLVSEWFGKPFAFTVNKYKNYSDSDIESVRNFLRDKK